MHIRWNHIFASICYNPFAYQLYCYIHCTKYPWLLDILLICDYIKDVSVANLFIDTWRLFKDVLMYIIHHQLQRIIPSLGNTPQLKCLSTNYISYLVWTNLSFLLNSYCLGDFYVGQCFDPRTNLNNIARNTFAYFRCIPFKNNSRKSNVHVKNKWKPQFFIFSSFSLSNRNVCNCLHFCMKVHK